MAAIKRVPVRYDNNCLQYAPADIDWEERIAEGATLKVGQLVKKGTDAEQILPNGADGETATHVAVGFWDTTAGNEGVYVDEPKKAIPDKARVKCLPLVSGCKFIGLLPDTVATTVGEKMKAAATGRVTNLTGTATADEVLSTYVRAREAVTATADDALVLLEVV